MNILGAEIYIYILFRHSLYRICQTCSETALFPLPHSDVVTHVVSEDSQASSLWAWLKGGPVKNLPVMHVLDISWFTDSMREGKPVAVETRHLIQVCVLQIRHNG